MTRLLSLICCLMLSAFVFGQTTQNITTEDDFKLIELTSCNQVNLCAEYEETDQKATCIQEATQSCNLNIDLEYILSVFDKRKSITTGVKSDEWKKLLKSISDSARLVIEKNNKTGTTFSVLNKKTGRPITRIALARINKNTFAYSSVKKLSTKSISSFIDGREPTYSNALTLVLIFLKNCSISVSLK